MEIARDDGALPTQPKHTRVQSTEAHKTDRQPAYGCMGVALYTEWVYKMKTAAIRDIERLKAQLAASAKGMIVSSETVNSLEATSVVRLALQLRKSLYGLNS
uniref:RxLR effector candidate protein n=1 Tax=Hyaloperonospora arabidopsidis (strain Emoy2) TaxID=559515 RepID=M4C4H8_HYAAE